MISFCRRGGMVEEVWDVPAGEDLLAKENAQLLRD